MSFTTWFEDELPGTGILKAYYEDYDNWNGGIYYLGIDFEKEYRLHYGIDYSDILKLEVPQNGRYKNVYRACIFMSG